MKFILNLYATSAEAKAAFNEFVEVNSKDIVSNAPRDLCLKTFNSSIKFSYYNSRLCSYQQDGICCQYSEINFHLDLPQNVKNHYLSRIRLPNI